MLRPFVAKLAQANTAREALDLLLANQAGDLIRTVALGVLEQASRITGKRGEGEISAVRLRRKSVARSGRSMKTAAKSDPNEWRPPTVLLVGLGLGREDLSARASRWLERAEVLAGGKRHLDSFPEFQGEKIPLEAPLEESLQRLKDHSERKRTAVLASGDPFFFGIGRRLARYLGKERLLTFPNATSVQALFAALGEAWEDVAVLSLHGGVRLAQPADWLRAVRSTARVALLTDPHRTPGWIAQQLIEAGMADRTLIVAEDLGLPTECIHRLPLEEARNRSFSPLNMVVVSREDRREDPRISQPRPSRFRAFRVSLRA